MKIASRLLSRSLRPGRRRPVAPAVEALESRTLLAVVVAQAIQGAFPSSFPQDQPPPPQDLNAFFFDTLTGAPDLTFTVKSDNTALVNASATNGQLQLTFTPGASGYAHLVVTATDPSRNVASQDVRIKVAAAPDRSLDVPLGPGRPSFHFVQADGTSATISLIGPGSGMIHMGGDQLELRSDHARGKNQEIESISLTGTTPATAILIRGQAHRSKLPVIGDISADGPLRGVKIKNTTLDGDLTAMGPGNRLEIDAALGGFISFGTSSHPMILNVGTFVDEGFSSGAPVRKANVSQWLNGDSIPDGFFAPFVKQVFALGSFEPAMRLSGMGATGRTLDHFRVLGFIGGPWKVQGPSGPLTVGGVASDFASQFDSLPSITDLGNFSGSLTVPSMRSIRVRGQMFGSSLNFTAGNTLDLGQLIVRGGIFTTAIQAAGNLGPITSAALDQSAVFAGVAPLPTGQSLPMTPSDFSSSSTIQSISLQPRRKIVGFLNSNVAASKIGRLSLGTTRTDNGGFPFGVAATQIAFLFARDQTHHQAFTLTNLHDPATLAAEIAARRLSLQDFKVNVVG